MPLTNDESRAAYDALAGFMGEASLAWILSQVEEKLALGKVSLKRVKVTEHPQLSKSWNDEEESRSSRKSSSAMFVASDEYTPQERLTVLIQALLSGVPCVHEIAETSLHTLMSVGNFDGLLFASDAGAMESFELDGATLERSRRGMTRLNDLLLELLKEVEDGTKPEPPR